MIFAKLETTLIPMIAGYEGGFVMLARNGTKAAVGLGLGVPAARTKGILISLRVSLLQEKRIYSAELRLNIAGTLVLPIFS